MTIRKHIRRYIIPLALLWGGNTCRAQNALPHSQAVEDIDFYTRAMTASHYAPFMHISRDDYYAQVEKIKRNIGDSISIKDFTLLFYKLTSLLDDAHSTPQLGQPAFGNDFKKEQFFPYQLAHDKNGVYAPVPLAKAIDVIPGTQLVDINGIGLKDLFREVEERIAGLPAFREEVAGRLLCYFLFLKNVKPPFVLGYKDAKHQYQQAAIKSGAPFKQALMATMPHIVQPFRSEILQNKLGYIDVRSLSVSTGNFRAFLDTTFRQFRQAGIRHLAIDLRSNSGGNTALGELLFSYITCKPYSFGMKSWRISEVYKNFMKTNGDTTDPYLQHPDGSIWESADNCLPEENRFKQDTIFNGQVFFITGPFTFSSAMAIADVVKQYKFGTLVGLPTGENTSDFGEAFTITLPNSQLKIQSTTSLSHGVNCHQEKNGPVLPDIMIKSDILGEKDPVLTYLLHLIK